MYVCMYIYLYHMPRWSACADDIYIICLVEAHAQMTNSELIASHTLCTHIYMYTCVFVCVCLYTSIYLCICMYVYMCMCICVCVCIFCIYTCIRVCSRVVRYMYVYAHKIYTFKYIWYIIWRLQADLWLTDSERMCVCVCVCVCVCADDQCRAPRKSPRCALKPQVVPIWFTHTHIHPYIHAFIHHTYIHTYTRTHTHTHSHTHTHTRINPQRQWCTAISSGCRVVRHRASQALHASEHTTCSH